MGTLISACITYILSIINNITGWMRNKSENKTITNNQNCKKLQKEIDNHLEIIQDAHNTKDLNELRKEASE